MNTDRTMLAIFHNLPSGGGIRVIDSMLPDLAEEFALTLHYPEGSALLTESECSDSREWPFPGGKRMRGIRRMLAPFSLPARLSALNRICRKVANEINSSADLVLVHNSMYVAAPPVLKYLDVPTLYFCYEYPRHIYEPDTIKRTDNPLGRLLLGRLRKLERRMDLDDVAAADSIVTLSSWMRDRILDIYGRKAKIIRPGIDTGFFRQKNCEVRNGVLSVGALWPYKGHDLVVESIAMMSSNARPAVTVVADREYPGYGSRLSARAQELGVSLDIRMNVSDISLRDLYSSSKVVLCCQKDEPYGLVPLEAMGCGTPVIAVNEGGFLDNVTDGKNGLLVERNADAIATALQRIIDDDDLWQNLSESGIEFVSRERSMASASKALVRMLMEML